MIEFVIQHLSPSTWQRVRDAFRGPARLAVITSLALSLTTLVMPIYTIQIYDRVLSSRSVPTLVAVTIITVIAVALTALLDLFRNIIFSRASAVLYAEFEARVLAACRRSALAGGLGRKSRPIDDLEMVRSFFASPVPGAVFDLIFVPLVLLVLFLIHPVIGFISLAFSVALILLAFLNRRAMQYTIDRSVLQMQNATNMAEAYLRAVEPAVAMGYATRAESIVAYAHREAIKSQVSSSTRAGSITALIKAMRQGSQIVILAVAAALTLKGSLTAGSIIASSILFGRAQAPIDQVVGAWRQIFQVRGAWVRLMQLIEKLPEHHTGMPLPKPQGSVSVQDVVAHAPEGRAPILKGISFDLRAGESLGIVGRSASGKSTLARVLLGAWQVHRGVVRLDGADVATLDFNSAGSALGYLPQTVDLLPGTVAQNIRRHGPEDPQGVVTAAKQAGAHQMILSLPSGYDTVLGESGYALSGGQRQRLGLARALYGNPSLVLLDEPDTGLDREGEQSLIQAIAMLREQKTTVIVIAHRPALVQNLDKMLVLVNGQIEKIGPTREILAHIMPTQIQAVRA